MEKWQTVQSTYIHQSSFGNIRKDTCKLPDGQIIHDYYVNEYDDWINALVVTKEDQIVLVKQYRHAASQLFLEIPAGKPEKDERYKDAIIREVKEETGFISEKAPILLGEFYVNPATQTNKVYTYVITDAYHAFDQDLDSTEWIDVHLVSKKRFEEMIATGEVTQLFTAAAYYMSQRLLFGKGG